MRVLLMMVALLLIAEGANAEDGNECFSKFTKFNVCEKAREFQRELAPSLPMTMNANIVLSTVTVVGPRILMTAVWRMSKADMDSSMLEGSMSLANLQARMSQLTHNSVCSQSALAAFIR